MTLGTGLPDPGWPEQLVSMELARLSCFPTLLSELPFAKMSPVSGSCRSIVGSISLPVGVNTGRTASRAMMTSTPRDLTSSGWKGIASPLMPPSTNKSNVR